MASIADLNVRLGLIYKDFDKGLEQVERKLRSSGRNLSALGDGLTLAISVPIAAAGAAAVKSAGDIESLGLALESQLGSAEAARKELELLRQEALKPGLGFEQAVRGSVSLQAVGFSAEKARETLAQFGNALALAGKGGQELDGVVLALTQIKAKGVVSAEEINQIAERLPQIRTLMLQAFGTASTESIQKLGITADQFIEGITSKMQNLPRAAGGIKNALENFFDGIKQGAAKFGLAISQAFDVPGKLESLTAGLISVADAFADLDPEVQKFIIGVAAAAVAAGPLIKVYGTLKLAGAQFIDVLQGAVGVTKNVAAGAINAASAFQKLNLAMKFTVAGAILAGATALYFAFQELSNSMTDAERAAKSVEQINRQAADSMVDEKLRAEALIGVLNDQTATRDQQKKALNELKAISPEYFGQLDLEKSKMQDLNTALDAYVNSLSRAATAQAAFERKKDIAKELNNLKEAADPSFWQQAANTILSAGNASLYAAKQAETFAENYTEKRATLEAEDKAMDEVIKKNTELGVVLNKTGTSVKNFAGVTQDAKNKSATLKEVISDIGNLRTSQDLLGARDVLAEADAIEGGLKKLLDAGFKPTSEQVQGLKQELQGLFTGFQVPVAPTVATLPTPEGVPQLGAAGGAAPDNSVNDAMQRAIQTVPAYVTAGQQIAEINAQIAAGTVSVAQGFQQIADILIENGPTMQAALAGAASAMVDLAASGESSFAALGRAALKGAADVVRAALMKAVASYIGDAFAKFGIFGAILAAGASAVVGGIFNKALKGLKVPAFAKGTQFAPGGVSLVGEAGPELVSLPRGSRVTPNNRLGSMLGGHAVQVTGEFRLEGTTLVAAVDKTRGKNERIKGY